MKKIVIISFLLAILISQAFTLTEARVQRVIDGDTIVLTNGERVRLIGIDAPEIGQPGANAATQFVQERTANRTIWLEADGNDRDAHGRLRRKVWLQQPTNPRDVNQIRQHQLNALLLSYGLANVMIVGNVRNAEIFRQLALLQILLLLLKVDLLVIGIHRYFIQQLVLRYRLGRIEFTSTQEKRLSVQDIELVVDVGHDKNACICYYFCFHLY